MEPYQVNLQVVPTMEIRLVGENVLIYSRNFVFVFSMGWCISCSYYYRYVSIGLHGSLTRYCRDYNQLTLLLGWQALSTIAEYIIILSQTGLIGLVD